jgi:hypothetical protein
MLRKEHKKNLLLRYLDIKRLKSQRPNRSCLKIISALITICRCYLPLDNLFREEFVDELEVVWLR